VSFIPVMKAEYSASLLQSSVSHDPSEITLIWWSDAQQTVMIIINIENSCAASYFCGNHNTFKVKKTKHTSEICLFTHF